MVEGADRIQASFSHEGAELIRVKGKDGIIQIPVKEWHGLLDLAKEGNIDVQVSVWSKEYPQGMAFQPFPIHVEDTVIDEWIAYRLIEPGYKSWRQIGLYQRNLSSFEESAIVTELVYLESASASFYIEDREVVGITYRNDVPFEFYPIALIPEDQIQRLPNFKWVPELRPTRENIFNKEIRPSKREERYSRQRPTFRIVESMDRFKERLLRQGRWVDREDELTPEIIEWRDSRERN